MKIPFDIKYRPQIESGKYNVFAHEHEEQEARIVCWDNKGEYPIVALIDNEPEKFDKYGRVPGGNRGEEFSLFIVTPEQELTEFEKEYIRLYKEGYADVKAGSKPISDDNLKGYAAELLDLAEKEIAKWHEHTVYLPKDTYYEQMKKQWEDGYDKGKAEALKDIEQDPESSYAFKRGVEYGKEEALKDLPRWKSFRRNSQDYPFFSNCEDGENCLVFYGKYIKMCELLKLPGFKEG